MFGISLKTIAVNVVVVVIALFVYDFVSAKIGNYEEGEV